MQVVLLHSSSQRESGHGDAKIDNAQEHGAKTYIVGAQAQDGREQNNLGQDKSEQDARTQDREPQAACAQDNQDIGITDLGPKPPERQIFATMVAPGDRAQRRARPETGGVQARKRKEDRGVIEALRGKELTPQDRRLSLGALDADLLHQSRRQ